MKLKQKFNTLTYSEYIRVIDDRKKIVNFNALGLFRSIVETTKLDLSQKIAVRDYANQFLQKSFDFLKVKDPSTYFYLITLGKDLTKADEQKINDDMARDREKILKNKRVKHRNFGIYSKHNCGYDSYPLNGLMVEQGSYFAESCMRFNSDKNRWSLTLKSNSRKKERKKMQQLIERELAAE